jgi:hypothetical protein
VKGGETERRTELEAEHSRRHAHFAHAQADSRELRGLHQPHHAEIVVLAVGHGGQLDNVGVQRRHPPMNLFEIRRCLAEVVVADDPFRLSVARNRRRDVLFQIDVIDARRDRGPQQNLSLALRLGPFAAVVLATAGENGRTRPFREQSLEIHRTHDPIDAQLDQPNALFGQILVFGDHLAMPPPPNADANHGASKSA